MKRMVVIRMDYQNLRDSFITNGNDGKFSFLYQILIQMNVFLTGFYIKRATIDLSQDC